MEIRNLVEEQFGEKILEIRSVSGGDINEAYRVVMPDTVCFLKINNAEKFPEMFQREAEGLEALRKNSAFRIPEILGFGKFRDTQFLFLEWIEQKVSAAGFWENFGRNIARMHQVTQTNFGWNTNNYMGSLVQENTDTEDFSEFFQHRISPLAKILLDKRDFSVKEIFALETLYKKLNEIFPEEPPAFIHGDLWSGNFMTDESGNPVLIDPAVSFCHREFDLGMTKLFGGFSEQMYRAYAEIYPPEKNWEKRLPLSQLYPLMIHAVLFGGVYIRRCREIISEF